VLTSAGPRSPRWSTRRRTSGAWSSTSSCSWRRKWARYIPKADVEPDTRQPDHAEAHAERSALLAEVVKLPRRQRAVLVLRYYEGMSDAQIAEVLGCAETTVRGYAFRGLAALRIEMKSAELR